MTPQEMFRSKQSHKGIDLSENYVPEPRGIGRGSGFVSQEANACRKPLPRIFLVIGLLNPCGEFELSEVIGQCQVFSSKTQKCA